MAELSRNEERKILGFVRGVISAACAGGNEPATPDIPRLAEKGACFVTLRENGEMRGCIGSLEAFESLADNLRRNAENAAFSDPAFPPLDADELGFASIEVSILASPRRLAFPEEADLERDGLLIVSGPRRAVFLPQVIKEQRWSMAEAWENLARKAGLASGAWRENSAELYAFRVDSFSE